ncbi:hypothetical protein F5884DRAFT_809026 [Xylogone sp. PMI_703]|nr:hypothetical protein F5884DRAFT_809026 [Xylogone sp. PMI_703]
MEDTNFDWPDDNYDSYDLNYGTPEFPISGSPRASPTAQQADPVVDPVDRPSGEHALPLLRLSSWERDRQYDKNNPICIHYDFRWKISQRENIRRRNICLDTDRDLVLAPSDFWEDSFQIRLGKIIDELKDEGKFPGDAYTCEETIVEISIERSRQRGLTKPCKKLDIDWPLIDNHLEGLGDLFSKGKKITLSMEFVYKEVTRDSTTAKDKKKKKSATEAQKLQRLAKSGLWNRVYKHRRCRAKHCKYGPHCFADKQGIHHPLLPVHLEHIVDYHKANIKEGEKLEDINVDIEIDWLSSLQDSCLSRQQGLRYR